MAVANSTDGVLSGERGLFYQVCTLAARVVAFVEHFREDTLSIHIPGKPHVTVSRGALLERGLASGIWKTAALLPVVSAPVENRSRRWELRTIVI